MAPEQILGKALDERTDIYALGLVIYDMLTNSVPFQSSRYGELLIAQVKEAPEPPSIRRARTRSAAPLPPALEQVVMRCLQKKPQDRFQNMRELRAALLRSVGAEVDESDPMRTQSVELDALQVPRRAPWLLIGLGLGSLLIGIAAVWWLLGDHQGKAGQPDAGGTVAAAAASSAPDSRPAPAVDAAVAARGPDVGRSDTSSAKTLASRPRPARRGARRAAAPPARPAKKGPTEQQPRRAGVEGTLDPFGQ